MRANLTTPLLQRRLAWLLWLALLLPMAQAVALKHGLSHLTQQTSTSSKADATLHEAQCELCLSIAAIGAGALPVSGPTLPALLATSQVPDSVVASVWIAVPTQPYRSRAPPSISL